MNGLRWAMMVAAALVFWTSSGREASAQRAWSHYGGVSPYGVPGHYHGGGYYPGGFAAPYGSYGGYGPYGSSYGLLGGYSGAAYGAGYGYSGYAYRGYVAPAPIMVAPPVLGTTTTIIRGGPTGGVIEYNKRGNGYTYNADSSYPSVVTQSPVIGPSRTYVVDGPDPVVIESRPPGSLSGNPSSLSRLPPSPSKAVGQIKLSCPKTAPGELSYSLNGNIYTIKPGYSQTFPEDREWTIEFKRGGDGSETVRYALKAGTYKFAAGPEGWDLQQPGVTAAPPTLDVPPAPIPEAPLPAP